MIVLPDPTRSADGELIHRDGSVAFTGDQSLGGNKLTNVEDPASAQDAATKAYVDAVARGLDWKASCRVATTANITLSGTQTIDGVSVIAGDRVLVKNQSTAADNGVYVCAAGSWSRAVDADVSAEVTSGLAVTVTEGSANGNKTFVLTTDDPITLGSTSLAFAQLGDGNSGGDVVGPASSTDNALSRFDGTTGKLIQNSGVTLDDNDKLQHKAAYETIITATDGATVTLNCNLGNKFKVTLGGNRTLAFSNLSLNQCVMLRVIQDGTGTRTLTYPANVEFAGGAPTLSTAAGEADWLGFVCIGTDGYGDPILDGFVLGLGYSR